MNSILDFSTVVDSETVSPFSDEDTTLQFTKYLDDRRYITINHDQLDKWKHDDFFKNGFYEYFKDSTYRRLYFDFDDMKNDSDFEEVLSFLDSLTPVCGNYAYAGTTTDQDIADLYDLTYIDTDDYNTKYPTIKELAVASGIKDFNLTTYMNTYYKKNHKPLENIKPKHHHTISIHVVFYEVCCNPNAMRKILNNSKFIKESTNPNIKYDTAVYANVGDDKTFRHVCAPKLFKYDVSSIKLNQADVPTCFKPSQLCVTCDGGERILQMRDLRKAIPIVLSSTPKRNALHEVEHVKPKIALSESVKEMIDEEIEVAKYEGNTKEVEKLQKQLNDTDKAETYVTLEEYTDEDFELPEGSNTFVTPILLDAFTNCLLDMKEPIHNYPKPCKEKPSTVPIFSGYFACINDKITEEMVMSKIAKLISKGTSNAQAQWYDRVSWSKKSYTSRSIFNLISTCRHWTPLLFKDIILPKLPKYRTILKTEFDLRELFCIKDIRMKGDKGEYQINGDKKHLDYDAVLSDLKRVMLVVDLGSGIYVIKERDAKNDRMIANYYNQETAFKMFKQLKVGTEVKIVNKEEKIINKTAFDIYDASTNNAMFYKNSICFYSENKDDFSFFQGYKYEPIQNDMLIEKFNNHIKNIICKSDEELYKYVQSWFSTIIQKPLARACTALVIKGTEGTGKNTMTDVWGELLRGYANSNVSDIDSIIGKFNTAVENKKLLVINEMDSAEMSTTAIFNRLKKLITEDTVDIHTKNVNVRTGVENIANLVILSNEFNPVRISTSDRRYCIITPSDEKVGAKAYFNDLYSNMKPSRTSPYVKEFMEALMYYYMNYKVEIDLTEIPETQERAIAKEANKSAIELFVEENAVELSGDGIAPKECFDMFNKFIVENKFKTNYKSTTFKAEMTKFCAVDDNNQLHRYKGKRVYRFTESMIKRCASLVEQIMKERDAQIDDDDIPTHDE